MKKIFDKKIILAFIIGLSFSIIGVAATSLYFASDIGYVPTDTKWKVDTIE